KLADRFHSLGLTELRLGLLTFLDFELQAAVYRFQIAGSLIDDRLDAARVARTEKQQRSEKTRADHAGHQHSPGLPSVVAFQIRARRYCLDPIAAATKVECFCVGWVASVFGKAVEKQSVGTCIDEAKVEHGGARSQKIGHEGPHPQRHGDNPGSVG